jgi:hypothetical protein
VCVCVWCVFVPSLWPRSFQLPGRARDLPDVKGVSVDTQAVFVGELSAAERRLMDRGKVVLRSSVGATAPNVSIPRRGFRSLDEQMARRLLNLSPHTAALLDRTTGRSHGARSKRY